MKNADRIVIIIFGICFLTFGIRTACWQSIISGLGLIAIVSIESMGDGK